MSRGDAQLYCRYMYYNMNLSIHSHFSNDTKNTAHIINRNKKNKAKACLDNVADQFAIFNVTVVHFTVETAVF